MKKFFLGAFILVDVALIGASGFVLFTYVHRSPVSALPLGLPLKTPSAAAMTISTSSVKAAGNALSQPSGSAESSTRRILFSYHDSHARQVSIRADFTGWKGEPMQKAANGSWTYQATLAPGEYAYCYTADDKTFKDPANKRTKLIGRTLVSAIVVEARPSKPAK